MDLYDFSVRARTCRWVGGGTPTQGQAPLEDGEQISFKVDYNVATLILTCAHF